jgi:hypothetical protein
MSPATVVTFSSPAEKRESIRSQITTWPPASAKPWVIVGRWSRR